LEPSNLILGKQAESLAVAFLKDKGFTILARNWRNRFEEIDIVAEKSDMLIIVEVKARKGKKYGMPYEQVGLKKQRLLVNAAEAYILKSNVNKETRFDIISIVFNSNGFELSHIEWAFSPFD
jgi:putative endonuclease